MSSLFSTAGLASASARHPWRTVGLWIAFVVAALVISSNFGGGMTGTTAYTNNPDSSRRRRRSRNGSALTRSPKPLSSAPKR